MAATYFARQNQMDLVVGITIGATLQMALFTALLLVVIAYTLVHPTDLVFANPLESATVVAGTVVLRLMAD